MVSGPFRRGESRQGIGKPTQIVVAEMGAARSDHDDKTRSIFERYNITSPGDLRDAARRLDAYASAVAK